MVCPCLYTCCGLVTIYFFWWSSVILITSAYALVSASACSLEKPEKKINEPAHDKTYNKTCATSKDSDQPVHPLSKARVLMHPSLDSWRL